MPCYHPLTGWRTKGVNKNGKKPIVFEQSKGIGDAMPIPCGQCIGCRLERARQWAMRCYHEASLHPENCFLTLTYDPENYPRDHAGYPTLDHREFQLFMKKLRQYIRRQDRKEYQAMVEALPNDAKIPKLQHRKIKFFMCGEYGTKCKKCHKGAEICSHDTSHVYDPELTHPHFHACIFNFDFPDKSLWSERDNVRLYRSPDLEKLWPSGYSTIGAVTFESAGYVARYCTKKITGADAQDHYMDIDYDTGLVCRDQKPEYIRMSLRPAVGKDWFKRFKSDLDKDFVTINGVKQKPAKYYDRLLEIDDPIDLERRKAERRKMASLNTKDNTCPRLRTREKIRLKRLKHNLTRSIEI